MGQLRDVDGRRQRQRHGEQQRDERGLEAADEQRDEVVFADARHGLPDMLRFVVVRPLMRIEHHRPGRGVERRVLVRGLFGRGLDLHQHQFTQRVPVHRAKLPGLQIEVLHQLLGRKFVHVRRGNDLRDRGTVRLAHQHGIGLFRDEQEDQEDHHDGGHRDEQDALLHEPFERPRAMAALESHPADGALGLGIVRGHWFGVLA